MNFDFSDDQEMLRDSVRKWVEKSYDFERRRAIVKTGGFSAEAWQGLADLGLLGLQVPEAQGGMGFGAVDAMVVMEELGRGLVLEPYAAVALVATHLLQAGKTTSSAALWLEGIARGQPGVALAQEERHSRYRLGHVQTRAQESGGSWHLSGAKIMVPAGGAAGAFIVSARTRGADDDANGVALFLVSKGEPGVEVTSYPTQDGASAADLVLTNATGIELLAAGDAMPALEHAVDIGIAALCAEAVGAMERLVALTVEYMNTRKQFGVPIATFQALRHRMADVKMQLELARSMSYYAALKLGEPASSRRRAISQAKVQLGQSMRFVGQQCIQLHGGIGVTDEYAASHYFKRLTVIEMSFGDTMFHLGEVSARMQDTAGVFA
ncbi:MAG: acyl-CoA dehydrogenase family protein [Pseudomonadota bacterium]|nr:acyl-CoA dehydrogenase family protein [Pseudomonadota bacterium]